MEQKRYECNLITPMLIHGEDTSVAELRPSSIKGAMRFWWRAIHGNLNLKQLKEQESNLFGGAGDNIAVRSSFRIKLSALSLRLGQIDPLPHKSNHFRIHGYEEKQSFQLDFIGKNLEIVEKVFELTTILGGLGQRSRRGFGSVQIQNQETVTVDYVQSLIQEINSEFKYQSDKNYPYIENIEIGKNYSDMNDLVRTISSATHNHNGDGMFGSVRGGRYASPVYISIIQSGQNYQPIITTLHATKKIDTERLKKFKEAIL